MTDVDQAAVEAVAKALRFQEHLAAALAAGNTYSLTPDEVWDRAGPWLHDGHRDLARAVLAVAGPHIRRKVAEEIAADIEAHYLGPDRPIIAAGRRELIEKVARYCAGIARKIGDAT